jgi:hypothetical protein
VFVTAALVSRLALPPLLANVVSVMILSVINFFGASTLVFRSMAALALLVVASQAHASDEAILQAKTQKDFAKYVATVEARRTREITNNEPFLDIERQPAQLAQTMAALKRGEVIVTRGAARDGSSNEIPDRRRARESLARHGVRSQGQAGCAAESAPGTAERQAQEDVLSSRRLCATAIRKKSTCGCGARNS